MATKNLRVSRGGKRDGERGAIAVMMGLLLTALLGFAALGFDLSYVRLARLEMKNASDAAAHAAIVRLRNSSGDAAASRTTAIDIASKNKILGKALTLQPNDVTFGTWEPSTKAFSAGSTPYNAVRINGVRESSSTNDGFINLAFGRALGYTQSSITEDTVGAYANRNFVIQMDITPTFICSMDQANLAILGLLGNLHTKNIGGDRIALDVFTGAANPFPVDGNSGFMNIRDSFDRIDYNWRGGVSYTNIFPGPKTTGIRPCSKTGYPTADWKCGSTTYPYPTTTGIQDCWAGGPTGYAATLYAGTDIGAAILQGTTRLATTASYEPRILILVTDGYPMVCTAEAGGGNCGSHPCCADAWCNEGALAGAAKEACKAAKAWKTKAENAAAAAGNDTNKIDLFTIKVGGGEFDTGSMFLKGLKQRRGQGMWISSAAGLAAAFDEIVGQIPVTLVQ